MAEEVEETSTPKEEKRRKKPSKFLVLGKYFLILLLLSGQGFLAYAVVHKYYPDIYEKMNTTGSEDFVDYELGELVVNPAQTNGKRYLLVEISLELASEDHVLKLEENMLKLKQQMSETLASRTVHELVEVEGRENIRSELIYIINSAIGDRSVRNLYFTKYIMQ